MNDVGVILKRFETPDEVRHLELGKFELVRLGGVTVGRATYQPGWKWSQHVGPGLGLERCAVEHVGLVLSGVATAAFEDGTVVELRAGELAVMRTAVAERLTTEHGQGHWSSAVSEKGVLRGIESSRVLVARRGGHLVATLRLATKKPWAIDPAYFHAAKRPLYLHDMAVAPEEQRQGLGRNLMVAAFAATRAWPADAIRLDAYDSPAGAGPFYAKCGFQEVGRVVYRTVPLIYYEWLG